MEDGSFKRNGVYSKSKCKSVSNDMKCSSSQSSVDSIFVKRMTMKNYTQNTYHETLSLCNACEYIAFGIVSHLRDGYVSVTMCKFSFFFFYRSLFHLASVLVSLFFSSTNAFFSSFKQKKMT